MNREILFRGKRVDNGEWVEGNLIIDADGSAWIVGEMVEGNDEYCIVEWWQPVDPETVGQFTGLLDKNGKRVFEDDIISYEDECYGTKHIGNIIWCAHKYDYPAFDVEDHQNDCNMLSHLICTNGFEVVGNVHDNAELLK